MRRRTVTGLVLFAFVAAASVWAIEPDGRVAFRYEWMGEKAPGQPRKLRISITALVPLDDARIEASAPSGTDKLLTTAFPAQGRGLGKLGAGAATVIELDVVEPAKGGEILTIALAGEQDGVPVREVVGIPVGTPGVEPVLRNGAAEFPAARAP